MSEKWWLDLPVNPRDDKLIQKPDEQVCSECFQILPKSGKCDCDD